MRNPERHPAPDIGAGAAPGSRPGYLGPPMAGRPEGRAVRHAAAAPLPFQSILFAGPLADTPLAATPPACVADLHLDQVIAAITAGREEYDIAPFFYTPLPDLAAIRYRHAVGRDLDDDGLRAGIQAFAQAMQAMRRYQALADQLHHPAQKQRWLLEACACYCAAVPALQDALERAPPRAPGLLAFRAYLADYTRSAAFTGLQAETQQVQAALAGVRYTLRLDGNGCTIGPYTDGLDYTAVVAATLARFRQGAVKDYRATLPSYPEMNPVEGRILDSVVQLYPGPFQALAAYSARHAAYAAATLARFDREIQVYLAYREYCAVLQRAGLPFCYPVLAADAKGIQVTETFDLALAAHLVRAGTPIVRNDVTLGGSERIGIVTGPNQGGKTTFARAVGQVQYLAALGCPVPGRTAQLFHCDAVFTHFEKAEAAGAGSGKLQDELQRLQTILGAATPRSLIILNDLFTATTLQDAIFLSRQILAAILARDVLCIWVTFLDELAAPRPEIVSLSSTVVPDHPAERTYRLVRCPPAGLAYAQALAEKYGLTYAALKARLPQ